MPRYSIKSIIVAFVLGSVIGPMLKPFVKPYMRDVAKTTVGLGLRMKKMAEEVAEDLEGVTAEASAEMTP